MAEDFPHSLSQFLHSISQQQNNHYFIPAMDVATVANSFIIRLDMPGMCGEDIQIDHQPGLLVIQGERKDDLADVPRIHHERPHSPFRRDVALPDSALTEEITASCSNGILTITVPLKDPEPPRRIEVENLE